MYEAYVGTWAPERAQVETHGPGHGSSTEGDGIALVRDFAGTSSDSTLDEEGGDELTHVPLAVDSPLGRAIWRFEHPCDYEERHCDWDAEAVAPVKALVQELAPSWWVPCFPDPKTNEPRWHNWLSEAEDPDWWPEPQTWPTEPLFCKDCGVPMPVELMVTMLFAEFTSRALGVLCEERVSLDIADALLVEFGDGEGRKGAELVRWAEHRAAAVAVDTQYAVDEVRRLMIVGLNVIRASLDEQASEALRTQERPFQLPVEPE
jgi:hypothetical protein